MFALSRPLFEWQKKLSVGVFVILSLSMAPEAVAADPLELLREFQKNKMPGN